VAVLDHHIRQALKAQAQAKHHIPIPVVDIVVCMVLPLTMDSHHTIDVLMLISTTKVQVKLATQKTTNVLMKLQLTILGSGFFSAFVASVAVDAVFSTLLRKARIRIRKIIQLKSK